AGLGAIGGPLAYWGGERLGALVLTSTFGSLTAIGLAWLTAMLVLLSVVRRVERGTEREPTLRVHGVVPAQEE
ncbi:MAG: DUF2878 domain-containing protein, partial [Gammaproteobacteria bacterium]|nr:DUF2878 domain-containing protein [Gammaproteobacteria bacterium]NIR83230.1 DUF2878 domain-containing protein [Gammaproteobacteria bacterium]NIR91038.1 DUF2878 domain-containing protein [Gammaproteobacteria bacterium]NIU04395.1 DUF2878 domain-containing protein [Gammaproteobacteria bacterium]NIV52618.1 DUF2878 family protein [Gammaproteobacteria bacterium]